MGEARQRKIARVEGRPWDRDRPPPPRAKPWYARDPKDPAPSPLISGQWMEDFGPSPARTSLAASLPEPARQRVLVVGDRDREALVDAVANRRPGEVVLVRGGEQAGPALVEVDLPRQPPVRRRWNPAELMLLLGALGMGGGGQSASEDPPRRR
jgi:hypothetical protein